MLQTPPTFRFFATNIRSEKYVDFDREKEEVITIPKAYNNKIFNWEFYSSRDITGILKIDQDHVQYKSYYHILNIKCENIFNDTISYMDFEKQKFQGRNYSKLFNNKYPKICIQFGAKCPYNCWVNIFLCLLSFGHIYKLILDRPWIEQNITIKKVVSTIYNLTEPKFDEMYNILNPKLLINNKLMSIDNFKYLNSNYRVRIPSDEELKSAEKYRAEIEEFHKNIKNDKIINEEILKAQLTGNSFNNNIQPVVVNNDSYHANETNTYQNIIINNNNNIFNDNTR